VELSIGTETARQYYAFELAAAAHKLVAEVMLAKPGENVVISADTQSDWRVVEATAQAAYVIGSTPTVIWYETRPNAQMEPPPPVAAAVANADVWIEYSVAYTLYTDARRQASRAGCRYGCMSAMDVDMLVRTVGKVNYPVMLQLGNKLCELTRAAEEIRITDANGMDIIARMDDSPINQSGGLGNVPGALVMLGGQVGWLPAEDSINGTVAFDATIWPPNEIGAVKTPVKLTIEKGRIVDIRGASEARIVEKWVAGFGDANMYRVAHFTYGFNPGVSRVTGRIVEDERLFGCSVFGFGGRDDRKAASHFDGVSSSPTIYLDGTPIECDGKYVHPGLVEICREMGIGGY
jgi:leucyl aminopeptidase (aminopeptidase T)